MTSTIHQPAVLEARGEFSLTASARFLEGFTPAARPDAAEESGALRLAFPVERSWEHAGVLIRQRAPGQVEVEIAHGSPETAVRQVRRILSLDVDGAGFSLVAQGDPVVRAASAEYPGLRPVLFHSPYEAAAWTIIGNRIRMTQAARIKQRLAEEHGVAIEVAGKKLASFPAPEQLLAMPRLPGLAEVKMDRLRAVARAARDGLLDAESLRELEAPEALRQLQRLPGIGPFSAELILVRGAGHPDVFPANEQRLHDQMRQSYGVPEASVAELAEIAEGWRPFRSWVALLLRTRREAEPVPEPRNREL
ncbi:DNA-3-methyladenine glycosylase 2 family protein [Amycolatopsis acidicola]|uniref:DNA-3-methyladenine glycosylase II n=1 Tax=Amycolatopsis acidicola TaxID=2596893 RepID=A0A5N0UUH2_9PSEU|nr:DNA-3-methyladenine glycosylase [Amycolatopsis acidicola]KAA9155785.1 DNA-3-methyladenine glycosylase 2 family protein [Amycolatopsis acidicola]